MPLKVVPYIKKNINFDKTKLTMKKNRCQCKMESSTHDNTQHAQTPSKKKNVTARSWIGNYLAALPDPKGEAL